MNSENQNNSSVRIIFILLILIIAILAANWILSAGLNWLATAAAMFLFCAVLGYHSKGNPLGILINERNLMSLSRFQMLLWTVIILSAYFTMAMMRITAKGIDDPLAIAIDWHLWALMGISTTSLVGTPMIHSIKKKKELDKTTGVIEKTARTFKEEPKDVENNSEGLLYGNTSTSDAKFTDMFEGDELNNTAYIDMSKVQMFFFTIIAALSYIVLLYHTIVTSASAEEGVKILNEFPALSEGLIAILAISHGGYLSSKNIDHTKVK